MQFHRFSIDSIDRLIKKNYGLWFKNYGLKKLWFTVTLIDKRDFILIDKRDI